jgi:putative SOS response-associated peptidase YedK
MCYHASTPLSERLIEHVRPLGIDVDMPDYQHYYHVTGFAHPQLPVTTNTEAHKIQPVIWGLLPFWAKDSKLADQTLNAVSETAFEKPAFRDSMRKRRCLIWVDGFFEWKHEGKEKVPHYLYMPGHRPFTFGGLWSDWRNPLSGVTIRTCSILTTPANELMASIHNSKMRMPLILDDKDWGAWLYEGSGEEELKSIMQPYSEGILLAREVSRRITDRTRDSNVPEVQQAAPGSGLCSF